MIHLKIYENFLENELLINIPELLNIKYWYIIRNPDSKIIYWKVEKISNDKYKITNLVEDKINNNVFDLDTLELLLKYGKDISIQYRPLTKEEIEEFEILIQANKYNI